MTRWTPPRGFSGHYWKLLRCGVPMAKARATVDLMDWQDFYAKHGVEPGRVVIGTAQVSNVHEQIMGRAHA